ncbi:MAG: dichloromethane dehalogenase [Piscirickettsiaceae bacterium]|nr:MAG: dichloromethane dehalogenase [Piscirickettsiaceae bacterium]
MNSTLRYLHHPTSQPCRAINQLLLEVDIPFEEEIVNLLDGDNELPSFKEKYNPTGQVPILCDGDFVIWESSAIAFYLNEKFDMPSHWFGATAQQKAIIQQYCHWHTSYLRRGAGAFFYSHFAECIWGKRDYSKEIAKGRYILDDSLNYLERWLTNNSYLCGDKISFADLLAYHELVSHVAGEILGNEDWQKHPNVKQWFDKISERPHSKPLSEMIMQVGAMRIAGEPIPMTRKTSLAKGTELTHVEYN